MAYDTIPYCGAAPLPSDIAASWNLDPVLILILASVTVYALREREKRAAATIGFLAILFVSPLCALGSALFSARVAQHVVLTGIAAPLLAAALLRQGRKLSANLPLWTSVSSVVFWVWHAPAPYVWALSSDGAYWLMQGSLLGSAVLFWGALFRASAPAATAALLIVMVQMGLLGALITFAPSALYLPHLFSTQAWGLSPLEDQQLAGLIMWVPAAGTYLGAALFVTWRMMSASAQTDPR